MRKLILLFVIIAIVIFIGGIVIFKINNLAKTFDDGSQVQIPHAESSQQNLPVSDKDKALECAQNLYSEFLARGVSFNSQCLGKCGLYSVDIVHVPRTAEDNQEENTCSYFRTGETPYFIELDSSGNLVEVYD